jgi:hypothetical protein
MSSRIPLSQHAVVDAHFSCIEIFAEKMPRIKADSGKSNKTPFCVRRKKLKPKTDNLFTEERKKSLAESDPKTIL